MHEGDLVNPRIRRKLRSLRSALRRRLLGEGMARLLLIVVALAFVTFLLDYMLRPDPQDYAPRFVFLAMMLGGAVWVIWRQLVRPLRVPMGQSALALLVENRYSQLDDRLISAIQFSRQDDMGETGVSEMMIARMAEQANQLAGPLNFKNVVERRNLRRAFAAAACAVMLFGGFAVWQYRLIRPWFMRTFAFAQVDYPQETYLSVTGGPDFSVVRGRDCKVFIQADGSTVPSYVIVHARYPSVGLTEERIDLISGGRGYEKVFQAVAEPFEFYVTGGDDRRDKRRKHRVRVIDPPGLSSVDFTVKYPEHMNRNRPAQVSGGSGVVPVPIGATVSLWAQSSKDLTAASVFLDGKKIERVKIMSSADQKGDSKVGRMIFGEFKVLGENRARSLTLTFSLTDTGKIANEKAGSYVIQVQPDNEPIVSLKKTGVGGLLTPNAVIPLRIKVKDDYGTAAMSVKIYTAGKKKPIYSEPIKDYIRGLSAFSAEHRLDLKDRGLNVGDRIFVELRVTDTLPKSLGGPNVGRSGRLGFRIVSPTDLMEELVRRQQELRLEFLQTIQIQESARAKTYNAAKITALGKITPEVRRIIRESAIVQGTVRSQCAKAADTLDGILDEMQNNRLGSTRDHTQIADGSIKPMRLLSDPMQDIVLALNKTAAVKEPAGLSTQAETISNLQLQVRERMEKIAENMERGTSRQELANELELIIKISKELEELIKKQSDEEKRRLLKTQPATNPATPG